MMGFAKGKRTIISVTVCLLLVYTGLLSVIESRRGDFGLSGKEHGIWDLPPMLLSAIAGEFKGMLASYIILDAGSRVGSQVERTVDGSFVTVNQPYNCDTLYRMIQASQHLDPVFQQSYSLSQGWLPWQPCHLVEKNIEILETARKNRPWDLFPVLYLAFNNYFFLNDYKKAGEILLQEAASRKNAPYYLSILGSRLSKKGGDTGAAIAFLQSIISNTDVEEPGYEMLQQRLLALQGVMVLEAAAKEYQKMFSVYPEEVGQLVEKEILSPVPKNPYKLEYCINQQGQVFFDRPDCRKQ
ncbi:tetratricopeptide repeat protein [Desulfogranum mediterraneum]|uniref:tetratricopeptide repeat protein n=1 Tax=Desulfogranum mediterraneum TaxID=160661 RepID=UPI000414B6C6|nr:hypothetical protein [Desulfogranum mediterraneum]